MKIKNSLDSLDNPKISGVFFIVWTLFSVPLWYSISPELPRCPWIGEATYSETYCLVDFILCISTMIVLIVGLWKNHQKYIIVGLVLLVTISLLELTRFNAITYFFFCLWLLWLLCQNDKTNYKHCLTILLTGVYFWSGFHKWNIHFYDDTYVWLMELSPMTKGLADKRWFSYIFPALESLPALMLLMPKTRRMGIAFLILMHLYIVYFMLIVEWGKVIIVWNLLMIILLLNLWSFQEGFKSFLKISNKYALLVLVLSSVIFPSLFCFDMITSELAYTMYCGRLLKGNMIFTQTDVKKLDKKYYPYLIKYNNLLVLDMDFFGFQAYNSELSRTEFAFKKMFRKLCEPYSDTCMLVITRSPMLGEKENEYIYSE